MRPCTFSRQVHNSPGGTLSQPAKSRVTPDGSQLHSNYEHSLSRHFIFTFTQWEIIEVVSTLVTLRTDEITLAVTIAVIITRDTIRTSVEAIAF